MRQTPSVKKDYRVSEQKVLGMSSLQIVEEAVFAVDEDASDITNEAVMQPLLTSVNPVLAAVYSAWVSSGFIAGDGLFSIFDCCCAEMLYRAPYGFHLLGCDDIARAVTFSFRFFPRGVIPRTVSKREYELKRGAYKLDMPELNLGGIAYEFELPNLFETDALLEAYRYEFVRPKRG